MGIHCGYEDIIFCVNLPGFSDAKAITEILFMNFPDKVILEEINAWISRQNVEDCLHHYRFHALPWGTKQNKNLEFLKVQICSVFLSWNIHVILLRNNSKPVSRLLDSGEEFYHQCRWFSVCASEIVCALCFLIVQLSEDIVWIFFLMIPNGTTRSYNNALCITTFICGSKCMCVIF